MVAPQRGQARWLVMGLIWTLAATAGPTLPVRYRFQPGEILRYETTAAVTVQTNLRQAGREVAREAGWELLDRVQQRVVDPAAGGAALLELRLEEFRAAPRRPAAGWPLTVRALEDGVAVGRGPEQWAVLPPDEPARPASPGELLQGLAGLDPADLVRSCQILCGHDGRLSPVAGQPWLSRLKVVPSLGQACGLLRPLGLIPPLPGREMPVGASYEQSQAVSLPGGSDSYLLEITGEVAEPTTLGPYQVVPVMLTGAVRVTGEAVDWPGLLPEEARFEIAELTHRAAGRLDLDPDRGRLVACRLRTAIELTGRIVGAGAPIEARLSVAAFTATGILASEP